MKRNGLLPIYGAACFALTASCDDSRPAASETKPAGSGLENRRRSPDSESATQSSDRVSVHARVDHLLKSLARLEPDEITVALKDRATLKLFMSLSPEEFLKLIDAAGRLNTAPEANERLIACNFLLKSYFMEMAKSNPDELAAILAKGNWPGAFYGAAICLAEAAPELAFSSLQQAAESNDKDAGSMESLALRVVTNEIAQKDPELAIRTVNASTLKAKDVLQDAMRGFAEGLDMEKLRPAQFAELLTKFSDERLQEYPEVARFAQFYANLNPAEVLASFPLDGTPWQRCGGIAYLEAAAFKGINGDVYVTDFLESPQSTLLTEQERGRLLHILRK